MLTVMTVSLLMPISSYGQGGRADGLFSNNSESYDDRADGDVSGGISNDSFGAPLGSGIFVFAAAAAGYVAVKWKTLKR